MKELQTFGWYASRIAPHLPEEAFKPVPARLLGGLAYLLIAIAGFLVIGLFNLHVMVNLGVALILGTAFAGMGFLGHEILHGTVVRKPWLRDFLGAIAFWPLTTGPKLWRKWHNMTHHIHTQDEEKDPDSWFSLENAAKYRVIRWIYSLPSSFLSFSSFVALAVTFTLHSTRMFTLYIKEFDPRQKPAVWIQFVLPWVTWIALLFIMGPGKWFFAFLLPLLIANFIVMCYIATNHRLNPLVSVNDPLANSLTVTVPKWVDVLHFNFSYHTEHHLFPGMNPKYYPLVKEQILRMWPERYHAMPMFKALYALWTTPRVYYQDTKLIDPHRGKVYGSLGHGLDPANIEYEQIDVQEALKVGIVNPSLKDQNL